MPAVLPGELIYLNLPLHPGSTADRTAPKPPTGVTQEVVTQVDVSGVALRWEPAKVERPADTYTFTRRWPDAARHTIKIVVRQDANMWAKGRTVSVDALHVIP